MICEKGFLPCEHVSFNLKWAWGEAVSLEMHAPTSAATTTTVSLLPLFGGFFFLLFSLHS
jgi:hypothetical protein